VQRVVEVRLMRSEIVLAIVLALGAALMRMPVLVHAQDVASPRDAAMAATSDVGPILEERLGAALATPGGLRADELAERAVATSADVRARASELEAAGLAVDQALAGYFPRVVVGASYTRLSDITMPALGTLVAAPGAASGQPIGSSQPLYAFGFQFPVLVNQTMLRAQLQIPLTDYLLRIAPGVEAAQSSREAALATSDATRRRTAADARVAYYTWVRARLQALVSDQALETVQDHLGQARSLVAAGSLPDADATRVEAQVAAAELLASRAHTLDAALVDRLHTILHDGEHGDLAIGDALSPTLPEVPTEAPAAAVEHAIDVRPELRALAATMHASDRQAAVASAGLWPQIVGLGEVLTADPNPRFVPQQDRFDTTWSLGVALTWSPNDFGVAIPATHAAEARRDAAAAQLDAMRDAIRTEVVQAWQAVHDARSALATTADGLRAAQATYDARRSLYAAGRATTLELLDAEIDLTRARLDALNARVDAAVARTRWEFAIGD
jgi:outer membrane protein TolC